jgi:hypothetical protein
MFIARVARRPVRLAFEILCDRAPEKPKSISFGRGWWVGVQPVDLVSATIAELGARTEAATSKDYAMTVSAALYDEYKQLSLERGLFPKGPNEFHDDYALGYAVYLLKMIPIPGKPNVGPLSEAGP